MPVRMEHMFGKIRIYTDYGQQILDCGSEKTKNQFKPFDAFIHKTSTEREKKIGQPFFIHWEKSELKPLHYWTFTWQIGKFA